MSRKHFEAIARVIARIQDYNTRKNTAVDMANTLAQFNSEFRETTFLRACALSEDDCKANH